MKNRSFVWFHFSFPRSLCEWANNNLDFQFYVGLVCFQGRCKLHTSTILMLKACANKGQELPDCLLRVIINMALSYILFGFVMEVLRKCVKVSSLSVR